MQQGFDGLKAARTSAPVLRVWGPARPTRALAAAQELAVSRSAILEPPDDSGAFNPVAFETRKVTQPERSYPPHLLEVVHALKALRPSLFDKPFALHTDNASLQWLQQQRYVSHHQARWLNLLAEYQNRVVHIPGRTSPADFLTSKRFPDGPGTARTRASTSRIRRLSSATRQTATSPPRFARPSRLAWFWGPWRRRRRRSTPSLLARRAAPSSAATGCSTAAAGAAIALAYLPRVRIRVARAPRCPAGRAPGSRQDAHPGDPRGAAALPACGGGGVRAHLHDVQVRVWLVPTFKTRHRDGGAQLGRVGAQRRGAA